jgi:hypothetical protein
MRHSGARTAISPGATFNTSPGKDCAMLSAVISKMRVKTVRDFGKSGTLTTLECVCENDLMAAYAQAEENRCFTKYSPWGEAVLGVCPFSGSIEAMRGKSLYVVVTKRGDGFISPRAQAMCWDPRRTYLDVRCHSILDMGDNQAKTVEVCQSYTGEKVGFNMKTAIDNPPAVEFFKPGADDYRVAFYDAEVFDRDSALADVFDRGGTGGE